MALKASDAFYIFDHFDVFFSAIENSKDLHIRHLQLAAHILYRTTERLGRMLDAYLKQEILDRQHDYLNLIKMVMYLLVGTVRTVDAIVKSHLVEYNTAGRKNKKPTDDRFKHYTDYENTRFEVLTQVCNIMQLPINNLWNMSIVDEDFVK